MSVFTTRKCKFKSDAILINPYINETYTSDMLKWNSRQKATRALFGIEYESNLHVNALLRQKKALWRFTIVSFSGKLIFNGVRGAVAR